MAKIALLIGVSEYGPGLNPLPGAVRDVEVVQQGLQPLEQGSFDEVKALSNPNPPVMREAIEALLSERSPDDTVLLFFSGHLIEDDTGKLYLATSITSKTPRAELIRVSSIPLSFVQNLMNNNLCQRQVVILDGCINRAWAEETAVNEDEFASIEDQLGGEGRAILTSFTLSQNGLESEDWEHSVYTRYWVEGISTGAADLDSDGWISVDELHEYTSNRVRIAAPALRPKRYPVNHQERILLAKAPMGEPKLSYRKQAETWVNRGEIPEAGRYLLHKFAEKWQITPQECSEVEAEVLKPHYEYQEKLQRYEQEYKSKILQNHPLEAPEREELKRLQLFLKLTDNDVAPIEERIALNLASTSESEDDVDEILHVDIESDRNSIPLIPNEVLPENTPIPTLQQLIDPIPVINVPSSLADSPPKSSSVSASTSSHKFLLIGIGGGLAALGLMYSVLSRMPFAPSADLVDTGSSSPNSSSKPSPSVKNSKNEPSPSPSPSPESEVCTIFINGNLRSEPAQFRDNVVESLREPLPVTGKRTPSGWTEVKLPNGRKAWAHPGVISSASEQEMETCLARKKIPLTTAEDILPP
ncbi:MAG TPA: caspase family protein [Allocoleopsis sp.]